MIVVRGARVHNLKNVNVTIPRNKLVVITGISGSGKSSLAFDTIYAEGQRRYVESLSAYARQFLGVMDKPDVDSIEGLSPAIAIDQKSVSRNPRSTVGTITEIYDYLRLLFARIGKPHCPQCSRSVVSQNVTQITDRILDLPKNSSIVVLGPIIKGVKGIHKSVLETISRAGYIRVRVDGEIYTIEEALKLELGRYKIHYIEAVVDRFALNQEIDRARIAESVETAIKLGEGTMIVQLGSPEKEKKDLLFSEKLTCLNCGISISEIEPRTFSFNSPHGACSSCTGLGKKLEVDPGLIIPNPKLTIGEGAIRPWAAASHRVGRQGWFWWKLEELSSHYGFSVDVSWNSLPAKIQKVILYGADDESVDFEGVIPNLERRWKETDSEWTRSEIEKYMNIKVCPVCNGSRLKPEALGVKVLNKNIAQVTAETITKNQEFFKELLDKGILKASESKIASPIIKEIISRLSFLVDVGLEYLTLDRESETLAGGEAQRIRLATQIGSQLVGVTYILDEPSIGLHSRDNGRLLQSLKQLKDLGNTVIVVEHDEQTMMESDWLIDVGPQAGRHGGEIVAEGTPQEVLKGKSLTALYLSGKAKIEVPKTTRKGNGNFLIIKGASEHNLKNIDVKIPLGCFVCLSGVSGSGKSTLMDDILVKALYKYFYNSKQEPGAHKIISGKEFIDKVVYVDQSPIGRTPRSNPATYTGVFGFVRSLFASTQEAKVRGYGPGRFSFNVKGGRCEACEGQGLKKIEMHFLPDVYVECEECHGTRFNREALEIKYQGKSIADVLSMSIEEALKFFKDVPAIKQKLATLNEVGLSYMQLGQPAPTLSGGEAQRVKLATELSRRGTGQTLYILDEPTTGLHFDDVKKLLSVLQKLVDKGNTILVIEHNLDVLKSADWVIDLGPEGGEGGGQIIAEGTPREIAKVKKSYTGQFLAKLF
ncbi:excinuclease ABC subunit UvrA [Candidatus Parcubacteria bacterium]|nr:MAG: excinuclease ABC subunit UvrA [Candidatus Parcubacteria bacterium]